MSVQNSRPPGRKHRIPPVLLALTLTAFAVLGLCSAVYSHVSLPAPSPPDLRGYRTVFVDDFDTLELGHTWHEGVWFNHAHAPLSNISVNSSVLSLVWSRNQGSNDTSISTFSREGKPFRAWRYGYFEARLRWDVRTGAWPAIWMIPIQSAIREKNYLQTRESGEIDIFEGQGDHPHTYYGTVHDWTGLKDSQNVSNHFELPASVDFSSFHVYGLLWLPGRLTWYLDGVPLHSEPTPAILDSQDFFLVIGMQEGINWKYGATDAGVPQQLRLDVDWVRVWQPSH